MHTEAIHPNAKRPLEQLSKTDVFTDFYLAGGTAAAIQLGHRISVDLDLFTKEDFEPAKLQKRLADDGIVLENFAPDVGTINATYRNTKISFFTYPYDLVEPLIDHEGAKLASLVDIGLMKLTAIASRGNKKDFIDLVMIIKEVGIEKLAKDFKRKYPVNEMDIYHYSKSLTYFDDADKDPDPVMLISMNWEDIKKRLKSIALQIQLV